jgi:Concanavalin A-like lectin/glucanases superfamily
MSLLTGTDTYLAMTGKVSHQVPLTHSCWLKLPTCPINTEITFQYLWISQGGTSMGNFAPHVLSNGTTGFTINTGIQDSSGWSYNITSDGSVVASFGQWHHVCFTYDNNGTPNTFGVQAVGVSGSKMYVDTILEPNGSSVIPTPPTLLLPPNNPQGVAMLNSGTGSNILEIAFPAIWLSILTQAEIAALAKGISPRKIQPQHLVSFSLLSGNDSDLANNPDMISGVNYNLNATFAGNGTTIHAGSPNPRIYV